MRKYYIIVDRLLQSGGRLTQRPARYRKNRKRYAVFGPYNLASARFQIFTMEGTVTKFTLGLLLGSLMTGTVAGAGTFYDSKGNVKAPAGSQQSFDYYRSRQFFLDASTMRRQTERDRLEQATTPCAR